MKRSSLDGKCWRPPPTRQISTSSPQPDMATLERTASINANLREASPPKKNPWNRNRPLSMASLSESCCDDPPLPTPSTKPRDSATVKTSATPTNTTTASPTRSRHSSSRTSSFSSAGVSNSMSPSSKRAHTPRKARRQLSAGSAESTSLSLAPSDASKLPVFVPPNEGHGSVEDPQKSLADGLSLIGGDRGLTNLDGLWKHPVGADVHVHTAVKSFFVHRDVVTSQSGWFREHLPPPNSDGSIAEIRLQCAPETAAYTLRFMYTHRIEICDDRQYFNPAHLPRCALSYCAAVHLRMKGMMAHILRIVEATANDLAKSLAAHFLNQEKEENWWIEFGEAHLGGALDIIYNQNAQDLMKPMRLALAGVLDATLFWLMAQAPFRHKMESEEWQGWMPRLLADLVEFRQMRDATRLATATLVPDESILEALLTSQAASNEKSDVVA